MSMDDGRLPRVIHVELNPVPETNSIDSIGIAAIIHSIASFFFLAAIAPCKVVQQSCHDVREA
jgi:hypothetical protein